MNNAALATPIDLIDSQSVSLIGLPAEKPAQRSLPGSADTLLRSIVETLNQMIAEVISKRTAEDLRKAELDVFPQYVSLVVAFARVASRAIDRNTIIRLNAESFCELEAEIRANGEACFGDGLTERATHTVWMLRKISDLLGMLQGSTTGGHVDQAKDAEFAGMFFLHAIRARFYVDCLVASMRTKQPLYRDVFPQVDDGLRSIVNAYAWIKQAVDLRLPSVDAESVTPEWTEEDRELADASMADLDRFDAD
jgi:hypothetical protein